MTASKLAADDPIGEDRFEERLAEIRAEQFGAIEPQALRWLALLPEWTDSLAEASGFPAAGGLDSVLERARAARLCYARRDTDLGGLSTVRFGMRSPLRARLLEEWQQQPDVRLEDDIEAIAAGILSADSTGVDVSAGMLRWAQLANDELAAQVVTGDALTDKVGDALRGGDVSEAFDWILAGKALEQLLGARMELATSRARQRVSLHYRRIQDEQEMEGFIRRSDQIAEVEALIDSEREWGLHFIGPGGVGKTMLMRFLTSKLEDNPIACASRVDFDYLDPRIPLETPARLLQELGEGLALDLAENAQDTLFRSFLETVTEAEAARSTAGQTLAGGSPIDGPEFKRAVRAFARFLHALPQPVALILDTCEELAKLHPPDGEMLSVSAMFRILESLHEEAPAVRVIIAGRRWLTPEYSNVTRPRDSMPGSVKAMGQRPYLKMHEVRGFSEGEVESYLRGARELGLSEEMLSAVLQNTIDRASAPGIGPQARATDEPRFSPNDVALIGDWIASAPALDPAMLAKGDFDPYVEARIVERLHDGVLAALPAVTVLGRFDAAAIEPALGRDAAERRQTLANLIAEDWTHLEGGPDPEEIVIRVDAGLLPRLRTYYEHDSRRAQKVAAAREELCEHLEHVLAKPAGTTTVEAIDAALRLMPLEQAVSGFDNMAERVALDAEWDWAQRVCERLLSPDREPVLDQALMPSVWVLYLSALMQGGAKVDLAPLWEGVAALAHNHPDPAQATVLAARGRLGALAADLAAGRDDETDARTALAKGRLVLEQPGGEAVAAGLLAAIEGLIDAQEERGAPIPIEAVAVCVSRLLSKFERDKAMQQHLIALVGRMYALAGDLRTAVHAFDRVERMQVGRGQVQPMLADWSPPASVRHRAMLELLRFRLYRGEETDGLLDRCERLARESPGGSDAGQLLSLTLQARLAHGTVAASSLELAAAHEDEADGYGPSAPAHHCAPPLFVSIAEGWIACGSAARGLKLLTARERLATSRRTDERAARSAALAIVRALRRLRLRERLALVGHSSVDDDELRAEALAAGALIAGLQPTARGSGEPDHAAWRARILLEGADDEDLLAPATNLGPDQPEQSLHVALDRLESELVFERLAGIRADTAGIERAKQAIRARLTEPAAEPTLGDPLASERLRLELRLAALLDQPAPTPPAGRQRQLAQLALDEGELLALRIPVRAIPLLEFAERHFTAAGDDYAAFTASLRAAIAEIHAGREGAARDRYPQVLTHYEQLRRANPSLPATWALGSRAKTAAAIDPADPWRAWVWRLSYYLLWHDDRKEEVADDAAMEFGPEFGLAPAKGAIAPTLAPGARALTRDLAGRPPSALLPLTGALLSLVAVAWIVSPLVSLIAAVLIGLAGIVIELLGPHLPRRVLPLAGFDALIISPPRGVEWPLSTGVVVAPRARRWPMKAYLRLGRTWRPRIGEVSIAGPGDSPHALDQALRPRLFGGYPSLRLMVGPDLAHVAWERRLVGHLARRSGWRPEGAPPIWRVRQSGFPSPPAAWPRSISAVCSPRWRQFLESSSGGDMRWRGDLGWATWPQRSGLQGDSSVEADGGEARAAFALGSPVATKVGWRLRLDDDEIATPLQTLSQPRQQQLISADRLVREGSVLVILGRPGEFPSPDARAADGLRGLANEAFLAGAHAVITIPVLPPIQAAVTVGLLAEELRAMPAVPDAEQLQRLATRVRTRLLGHPDDGDEEERLRRIELLFDVCLFAPSE